MVGVDLVLGVCWCWFRMGFRSDFGFYMRVRLFGVVFSFMGIVGVWIAAGFGFWVLVCGLP